MVTHYCLLKISNIYISSKLEEAFMNFQSHLRFPDGALVEKEFTELTEAALQDTIEVRCLNASNLPLSEGFSRRPESLPHSGESRSFEQIRNKWFRQALTLWANWRRFVLFLWRGRIFRRFYKCQLLPWGVICSNLIGWCRGLCPKIHNRERVWWKLRISMHVVEIEMKRWFVLSGV